MKAAFWVKCGMIAILMRNILPLTNSVVFRLAITTMYHNSFKNNFTPPHPTSFTRDQFWPLRIVITCVCVSVHVSVCVYQALACTHDNSSAVQPKVTLFGSGVRCCFWLNLSFDLSLNKPCLNFWLKSKIRLKSETAPHPRGAKHFG